MSNYLKPITLVDTEWVAQNYDNPNVRVVEVNKDPDLYLTGHIPRAIHWHPDWQEYNSRNMLAGRRLAYLSSRMLNVSETTTIVFYGAGHNWWASLAFWIFKRFGHADCRLLDGGREKWVAEGRPLTREVPMFTETDYYLSLHTERKDTLFRATTEDVISTIFKGKSVIDVRSSEEYLGEVAYVSKLYKNMLPPETGHIPTAIHINWKSLLEENGTFKPKEKLIDILNESGVDPNDEIIVYCSVGERSGHTWFALRYLVGCPNVRNYDASWLAWGSDPTLPRVSGPLPGKWPELMSAPSTWWKHLIPAETFSK